MLSKSHIKNGLLALAGLCLALLVAKIFASGAVIPGLALGVLPVALIYLIVVFKYPIVGVHSTLIAAFFALGIARYQEGKFGLLIDALVLLTLVATVLNKRVSKANHKLHNVAFYSTLVWFIITFLELFNPLAPNMTAWFYAVRGVSLYALLLMPACLWLLTEEKDIKAILTTWLALASIGALWGIKQKHLGLDAAETRWIQGPDGKTHMLRGKLRVFSFFSDSGQYAAVMCHASLVAFILFTGPFSRIKKTIFLGIAILTFYGLIISGTRGAFAVAAAGGLLYLFLTRNFKLFSLGLGSMLLFIGLLKFTSIGSGSYDIQRMRTALDPNNASLQVRLENQKILARYMADKPFGKGIGSGGSWAKRFNPDGFLAQVPLDSWFVKIWVETGVVGLIIHIALILLVTYIGARRVYQLPRSKYRTILNAMVSGFFGIAVASYGNQIYGQIPTVIILIISIALLSVKPEKFAGLDFRNHR